MISRRVSSLLSTCIVVMLLMSNASAMDDNNNSNEVEDFIPGTNVRRRAEFLSVSGLQRVVVDFMVYVEDRIPEDCPKFLESIGFESFDAVLQSRTSVSATNEFDQLIQTHKIEKEPTKRELAKSEGGLRSTNQRQQEEQRKLQDAECRACKWSPNCEVCCLVYCNVNNWCGTNGHLGNICERRRNLNEIRYDDFEQEMNRRLDANRAEHVATKTRNDLLALQGLALLEHDGNCCFGSGDIVVRSFASYSGIESSFEAAPVSVSTTDVSFTEVSKTNIMAIGEEVVP